MIISERSSLKGQQMVELLVAFGTDDGENLNNDHVGMARYFYVYRFSGGKERFVEQRKNIGFKGDESMKHGDPEKAKATSSVLQNVDVLVGKKFGPNLPRLLKKFVCVLVRTDAISNAIEAVHNNMDRIAEERNKGGGRKHIVLRP
jgi:predicted Fe-Mo cluster-binding NifX family protein